MAIVHGREGKVRFSMDAAFKLIIRNADVLARIVVGTIKEFEGMEPEEARGYLELDESGVTVVSRDGELFWDDRSIGIRDNVFKVRAPEGSPYGGYILDVEGEGCYDKSLPSRELFYSSASYVGQKFRVYLNKHYERSLMVYAVWIYMEGPKYLKGSASRFGGLKPEPIDGSKKTSDADHKMRIAQIFVGGEADEGSLRDMLNDLFHDEHPLGVRLKHLKDVHHIRLNEEMVNGVKKMSSMWSSYKKGARLLAIAEGKEQGIAEGKEQGIAEGKEQGIAEGKEQGRAEEKARAVRSMAHTAIRTGLPVDDALLLFDEEYRPLIREEMERIRSQEA